MGHNTSYTTPQEWDRHYANGRRFRPLGDAERTLLAEHAPAPEGGTALDVGCGTGELADHLTRLGYRVDAVDCADSALTHARTRYADNGDVRWLRLDVERADLAELGDDGYDLVTLRLVCPFLRDRVRLLHGLGERLRPGGRLVMITPLADQVPDSRRGIALDEAEIGLLTEGWERAERFDAEGLAMLVLRGAPHGFDPEENSRPAPPASAGAGAAAGADAAADAGAGVTGDEGRVRRGVWPTVTALARTFDAHGDARGVAPEQQWALQVLKLAEETGEAAQAVIGAQGTNPRKGYSHGWQDVHAEVADVVITGLVALARMRPEDAADYLERQLAAKAARFL
ncbi:methyltransferase [Streptomyces smyrnaeus]|uniref:methyltransferase n=1 Tax=Streptomyces smyrnaeus TaxID=1387713 RepID=UPI00369F8A34